MAAHRIYLHLTWATRDRRPMVDKPTQAFLVDYFKRIAIRTRAGLLALAVLQTHIHLLIRVRPTFDVSKLVQALKGGSSYLASRQPGNRLGLRWTREYSVTSVSPKLLKQALAYIAGQDQRHPRERVPHSHAKAL
ncbi:MAG TPA: IS200/IS605 family transposase [Gemmatimonadaceae bacterium]